MFMVEYEARFHKLSRYATMILLIKYEQIDALLGDKDYYFIGIHRVN